jgi:uncharacterized membrane protein YsdA (DUF1294 family)
MAYILFSLFSLLVMIPVYAFLRINVHWHNYFVWLGTASLVTFGMYGLDKLLAKLGVLRVPNNVFHWLALVGGFPGGWVGRQVFHHKTNRQEYWEYPVILGLSTLIHGALIWYFFLRPG